MHVKHMPNTDQALATDPFVAFVPEGVSCGNATARQGLTDLSGTGSGSYTLGSPILTRGLFVPCFAPHGTAGIWIEQVSSGMATTVIFCVF